MLNRDFKQSNKEYLRKNKSILITLAVFLLVGVLLWAVLGMNGNFEINGCYEFNVTVGESAVEDFSEHKSEIGNILNSYDAKFDTLLIYGEGDDCQYVVRYLNKIKLDAQSDINALIADELNIDVDLISDHTRISPIVQTKDYVYTATAILLIVVVSTIFAYARYNGASALAVILATLIGTLGFISFTSILRLSVGMSYFGLLVILNMMISYFAINMFETMHKSSWLVSGDYETAIKTTFNASKTRMALISVAIAVIGLLFALIAPLTMKYVAVNVIFMAVSLLATGWYVIPFVWSMFITRCRKRNYKIKATDVENNK